MLLVYVAQTTGDWRQRARRDVEGNTGQKTRKGKEAASDLEEAACWTVEVTKSCQQGCPSRLFLRESIYDKRTWEIGPQ